MTKIDITPYLPEVNSYAWAGQISDHPDIDGVARILILERVNIDAKNKLIALDARLKHIKLDGMQDISHQFNGVIMDWMVSNTYKTTVRNEQGQPTPNPEFVPESEREEGVDYTEDQMEEYLRIPAFDHFLGILKKVLTPLFDGVVAVEDGIVHLFDEYKSVMEKLNGK